jgi:hypothetical protein
MIASRRASGPCARTAAMLGRSYRARRGWSRVLATTACNRSPGCEATCSSSASVRSGERRRDAQHRDQTAATARVLRRSRALSRLPRVLHRQGVARRAPRSRRRRQREDHHLDHPRQRRPADLHAARRRLLPGPEPVRSTSRGRRGVGLLVFALSLISAACASRTPTASAVASRVSFVVAANRLAGLPVAPDTSYRRTVRYFARAGLHGSSSFPDGLCRLRFEKIGLSMTFISLAAGAATPANCTFRPMAVVTGSRWRTANGLHVGAPLASLRRIFPRASKTGAIPGKHWGIPTGSTVWWLANFASSSHAARPVLVAYVRGGRVAALGITIVGH